MLQVQMTWEEYLETSKRQLRNEVSAAIANRVMQESLRIVKEETARVQLGSGDLQAALYTGVLNAVKALEEKRKERR